MKLFRFKSCLSIFLLCDFSNRLGCLVVAEGVRPARVRSRERPSFVEHIN